MSNGLKCPIICKIQTIPSPSCPLDCLTFENNIVKSPNQKKNSYLSKEYSNLEHNVVNVLKNNMTNQQINFNK